MTKVITLFETESQIMQRGVQSVFDEIKEVDDQIEKLKQRRAVLYGKVADSTATINELKKSSQEPYR